MSFASFVPFHHFSPGLLNIFNFDLNLFTAKMIDRISQLYSVCLCFLCNEKSNYQMNIVCINIFTLANDLLRVRQC